MSETGLKEQAQSPRCRNVFSPFEKQQGQHGGSGVSQGESGRHNRSLETLAFT